VKWLRKAAEQNLASAQCDLASFFHYGRGVAKDGVAAYKWAFLASAQGLPEAKVLLTTLKVFEYALPVESSLQALVGKVPDKDMLPIHESRLNPQDRVFLSRRAEGIRLLQERMRKAVEN
jgi:TPR repeat protein